MNFYIVFSNLYIVEQIVNTFCNFLKTIVLYLMEKIKYGLIVPLVNFMSTFLKLIFFQFQVFCWKSLSPFNLLTLNQSTYAIKYFFQYSLVLALAIS